MTANGPLLAWMALIASCAAEPPSEVERETQSRATPTAPQPSEATTPWGGTWERMTTEGAPSARESAGAVIVGDEVVIWGGDDAQTERVVTSRSTVPSNAPELVGGVYDLRTRRWRAISRDGQPQRGRSLRTPTMYALSGRRVVICNRHPGECTLYDVGTDRWHAMSQPPTGSHWGGQAQCVVVDSGAELICVGGTVVLGTRESTLDFFRYVASEDRWERIATSLAGLMPLEGPVRSTGGARILATRLDEGALERQFRIVDVVRPDTENRLGSVTDETKLPLVFAQSPRRTLHDAQTGSFYLVGAKDHDCRPGRTPECATTLRAQRFLDGVLSCFDVVVPGPAFDHNMDFRPNEIDCSLLAEPDTFFCHGERIVYDNPRFRVRAFDALGVGCAFEAGGLRCWSVAIEGQPPLRRHAAQAFADGRLVVWGGRSTVMTGPDDDCTRPGGGLYCGMARNGPLVSDGAIYTHARGRDIAGVPCSGLRVD